MTLTQEASRGYSLEMGYETEFEAPQRAPDEDSGEGSKKNS